MAWQSPRTWVAGETVTAALMNTHVRDNLAAIGAAWDAYTPTLSSGGTQGNAVMSGGVLKAGKLTEFWARMVLGSTSTITGSPTLSLPVTARTAASFAALSCTLLDSGLSNYGAAASPGTTSVSVFVRGTNDIFVGITSTVPFTWAVNDAIDVRGTYEAA